MANQPFDGVVEAVRYSPDGRVELVRFYERRGATYSDHCLLNRAQLIQRIRAGKRFVLGARQRYLASTFILGAPLRLDGQGEQTLITTQTGASGGKDQLAGIPRF